MNAESLRKKLLAHFEDFVQRLGRARGCESCGREGTLWFNGWRVRSASLLVESQVVHLPKIRLRRVRCPDCRTSFTLWPPGLIPRRHYQPCVVSWALGQLLGAPSSEEEVAASVGCARRTVGRWLRWLASVAEPADLAQRLLLASGEPILPSLNWARGCLEGIRKTTRRALLERVAEVLSLLWALASVSGLELSELLPAVARRQGGVASERLAM